MWSPTARAKYSRAGLRCGSDLTDAEWQLIEPYLPSPRPCGLRRRWSMRRIAYADSAYASPCVAMTTAVDIEIVRKFADHAGEIAAQLLDARLQPR